MSEENKKTQDADMPSSAGIAAKGGFILITIGMALLCCQTHSKWWLIGYGAIVLGSMTAVMNSKLSQSQVINLFLCDFLLLVLLIVGFFVNSVWLIIFQIIVGIGVGGNLHNQWEAVQKKDDPAEPEAESTQMKNPETDKKTVSDLPETSPEFQREVLIVKGQLYEFARDLELDKLWAFLKENKGSVYFKKAMEAFTEEALQDDMKSCHTLGITGVYLGMLDRSEDNVAVGMQAIARAANLNHIPAMTFIGSLYKNLHSEFASQEKKTVAHTLLAIIADNCDIERCYRNTLYRIG